MTQLSIATWNVNSVKTRLEHLVRYLREWKHDVVLLQELKCQKEAFPYIEIEELGYNVVVHGQKSYNGVAILSRYPIEDVVTALPLGNDDPADEEARYIEGLICLKDQAVRVASVYVPNGQSPDSPKFFYKLRFFERLRERMQGLRAFEEMLVVGGDYNVAPEAIDVFDPKSLDGTTCYHPKERARYRSLCYLGMVDAYRAVNDNRQEFSWWDYRAGAWEQNKGMRIDHLLLSPEAADRLEGVEIIEATRGWEKPSDHVPVMCTLNLG